MGVLKVRVNGAWEEALAATSSEVWRGTVAPDPSSPSYDLWVDPSTFPPTLKAKTPQGTWESVTGADEVWIGADDPDIANSGNTLELWLDTTTDPAVLKGKINGAWVPIGGSGTEHEVVVGPDDPMPNDALVELWYVPKIGAPITPPALWDAAVTYQAGDYSFWPDDSIHYQATAITVGQEPGTSVIVPGGYQFPGAGANPQGLAARASVMTPDAGYRVIVRTNNAVGVGAFFSVVDGTGAPGLSFGVYADTDLEVGIRGSTTGSGTHQWRTPLSQFNLLTRPWLSIVVNPSAQMITFFDSVDGVTWNQVTTVDTSADAMQLAGIGPSFFIGTGGLTAASNYDGVLGQVTMTDLAGTTLWTSWDSYTQPSTDGTGVSPLTGEDYALEGPVPLVPGASVPIPTPWVLTAAPPLAGVPGVLRANVNGTWEDVASGGGSEETHVGNDEPIASTVEFWYDTDDTSNPPGSFLPLAGGTMSPDAVIQWPNQADVPKVNYYGDTFGVGIESGTQTLFASSRIRFRIGTPADPARGGITSPIEAEIDANGMWVGGNQVLTNVTGLPKPSGVVNHVVNNFTGDRAIARFGPGQNTLWKICGYASKTFTNASSLLGFEVISGERPGAAAHGTYSMRITHYANTAASSLGQYLALYRDDATGYAYVVVKSNSTASNVRIWMENTLNGGVDFSVIPVDPSWVKVAETTTLNELVTGGQMVAADDGDPV
jgi:hypothetical protein